MHVNCTVQKSNIPSPQLIFVIKNASGRRTIGKKRAVENPREEFQLPVRLVQRDEVHCARGAPRLDRPSDEGDVVVVDGGGARELHLLARRVDLLREIGRKCKRSSWRTRGRREWGGDYTTPMFQNTVGWVLSDGKMMFFSF